MLTQKKSKFFSAFSLILMLFICQSNVYGFVWCFCDQETTKLEQRHLGCNQLSHSAEKECSDHSSHFSCEDHTGPCLDLLPSANYTTARQRQDLFKHQVVSLLLPCQQILTTCSAPLNPPQPFFVAQPRVSQQIVHHRTIVLRR
ncbi:MAG: hypothetical protein C0620_10660 [Desulfuromonas sp.]|nr:MAG: hypothetical protein C0620_10660 [Desulfuromonas sp.]